MRHRAVLLLPLASLVLWLTACEQQVAQRPKMVASYSFSQVEVREPIGFQLSEVEADTLLVRVDGHETELHSNIYGASGRLESSVRLPVLRLGPMFHVNQADSDSRPFEVRVVPRQVTADSHVRIRVLALPGESAAELARIEAYKSYEAAMQIDADATAEGQLQQIDQLRLAAAGFARAEEVEEQLWANFLEACLQYSYQPDAELALDQLLKIQQRAERANLQQVRLAGMLLEGKILTTTLDEDSVELAHAKHVRGQDVLKAAVELAVSLDLPVEQAWALRARGDSYLELKSYTYAETMFNKALDIARTIEDKGMEELLLNRLELTRQEAS